MKRLSLAILALCATSFAQDNLALWTKYKVIAINTKATGANVVGNVSKVPVLVRLDSVNAADVFASVGGAQAGGADIRFSDAAGVQKPFEIEQWDATAKKAAIWVLADSVKGNDSVAALRVYWGNLSAASASSNMVFDTANGFVGAWLLGNASGTAPRPSSVIGAPPAIVRNALPPVDGLIGKADSLFGNFASSNPNGTYIDFGRNDTLGNRNFAGFSNFTTGFSFSMWIKTPAMANFVRLLNMGVDSTGVQAANSIGDRIVAFHHTTPYMGVRGLGIEFGNTNGNNLAGTIYNAGDWTHLQITKQPGTSSYTVYKNGSLFGATGAVANPNNIVRNLFWIGRSDDGNGYFNGLVDNVTLAKQGRDSNFVKLSYQTQKAAANAVVLGATQNQSVTPVAIAGLAYSAKAADTVNILTGKAFTVSPTYTGGPVDSFKVVSGTLPAGLALATSTGVISGTPTAAAAAANYTIRAYGHASAGDSVSRAVRIAVFAPATLAITPDSIDVNKDATFPTQTVTYTGAPVTAYSVTPALPAGLTLNSTTGMISGTPTATVARASYTIKAKNSLDSATKVLRISVIDPTAIDGMSGLAATGFSARSYAQGIVFRVGTPAGEKAVLSLVDMWGRTVYAGAFQGGALNWNGKSTNGQSVSSGVYVARVKILDAQGRTRKVSEHKVPFTR